MQYLLMLCMLKLTCGVIGFVCRLSKAMQHVDLTVRHVCQSSTLHILMQCTVAMTVCHWHCMVWQWQ